MIFASLFACTILILTTSYVNGTYSRNETGAEQLWKLRATVATSTYERLKKCLTFDRIYRFVYPSDAEEHFEELKHASAKFRGLKPHTGQGYYREKWIENYFIDSFLDRPLADFSGLFPLFVQWTDYDKREHDRDPHLTANQRARLFQDVIKLLRHDVMYVTVSQANKGLAAVKWRHPNVLVINAGGDGNIPIPLIKGKIRRQPIPPHSAFPWHVGFVGHSEGHDISRVKALRNVMNSVTAHNRRVQREHSAAIETCEQYIRYDTHSSTDNSTEWQYIMGGSLFNLAPRGFGRATFRLAEVMQMGRVPVYMYDDYPWIPYAGTPAGCDKLGFVVRGTRRVEVDDLVERIGNLLYAYGDCDGKVKESTIRRLLDAVEAQRFWYTYKGVIKQLKLFFSDPLDSSKKGLDGGGYLRCARVGHAELVEPLNTKAMLD